MKFCETCGNIYRVHTENEERSLYCKTCNKKIKLDEDIILSESAGGDKKEIIVVDEKEENTFPVTEVMCPQCNEMREALWTMQQTRGGDEPPTRFYECKTCNWRWREYS